MLLRECRGEEIICLRKAGKVGNYRVQNNILPIC